MRVADEPVGFVQVAMHCACSYQSSVFFYQFFYACIADDLTSHAPDVANQGIHQQRTVAFQSPGAFDEAVVPLCESVERQSVLVEFHLER